MLNRRTLFKAIAAVGSGSVFTQKSGEAAALSHNLRFDELSNSLQLKQPSAQEDEGLLLGLLSMERVEDLMEEVDCVELMTRYGWLHNVSFVPLSERQYPEAEWKADCPFCKGRKGHSLRIGHDFYWCQICNACGSAIDFYCKMAKVTVAEGMSHLEELLKNGVLKGQRLVQEFQWEMMTEAERFYHELLVTRTEGAPARQWLKDQGISAAVTDQFGLGYAPLKPSNRLSAHLRSKGYLAGATKCISVPGGKSDRFRGMLIPRRDEQGRNFGFYTGNCLPANSMTSCWSCESTNWGIRTRRMLFPATLWPRDFNRYDSVLLAPSPWDVIALRNAGIPNVVYMDSGYLKMRSTMALARTVLYPWFLEGTLGGRGNPMRPGVNSQGRFVPHNLNELPVLGFLTSVGRHYDRMRLLMVPDHFESLPEMLKSEGADAVLAAMNNGVPIHEWLGV